MNRPVIDQLVNAVLYEGYILYPYRPSVKNRQRWTFGGLYPDSWCLSHPGADACSMQTECLIRGDLQSVVKVQVRFLHLQQRLIGICAGNDAKVQVVESLEVDGKKYITWQEAIERTIDFGQHVSLGDLLAHPRQDRCTFAGRHEYEPIHTGTGETAGAVLREQHAVECTVATSVQQVGDGLFRMTVRLHNETPLADAAQTSRDDALMRSLLSTHTILSVRHGEFVSLLDPPQAWLASAAECHNEGAWPVLVGEPGQKDMMLSSPIILYDYPQVAAESQGDHFDATEIDEMLTLRILTLTDDEKRAMSALDARARSLLQRTEALSMAKMCGLHGMVRSARGDRP